MTTLVVLPMIGVGPVLLGAKRDEVHAALGTPDDSFLKVPTSLHQTDAWFDNCLQVSYEGEQAKVSFIEMSSSADYDVVLFGLSVFGTLVPVLVDEVRRHALLDESDPELGYSFIFPTIELALWRPADDDEEAPYVSTVGIGTPGYYSASSANDA